MVMKNKRNLEDRWVNDRELLKIKFEYNLEKGQTVGFSSDGDEHFRIAWTVQ